MYLGPLGADPSDYCLRCNTVVPRHWMVWPEPDLYCCHRCAGAPEPMHDWGSSSLVTG